MTDEAWLADHMRRRLIKAIQVSAPKAVAADDRTLRTLEGVTVDVTFGSMQDIEAEILRTGVAAARFIENLRDNKDELLLARLRTWTTFNTLELYAAEVLA